jgi:hypothetical protein
VQAPAVSFRGSALGCDQVRRKRKSRRASPRFSYGRDPDLIRFLEWKADLEGLGREEINKIETEPVVADCSIMCFGGRAKRSNEKLDENFGRNLSSFIIRYRLVQYPCVAPG